MAHNWLVSLQMYIPNKGGTYRSTYRKIILPNQDSKSDDLIETQYIQYLRWVVTHVIEISKDKYGKQPKSKCLFIFHFFRLNRIHWKSLDQESERCSNTLFKPDVTRCITSYMEKKAGCTLPVQGATDKDIPLCKNMTTISKFLELNRFNINIQVDPR